MADGSKKIVNQGQKSPKKITIQSVCKNDSGYFLLYETENLKDDNAYLNQLLIPPIYAAGGGSPPSNFAYISADGKSQFIVENLQDRIIPVKAPWFRAGPYYGCRQILGSTSNTVIFRCGGEGAGGLMFLNLSSQIIEEQVICGSTNQEGFAVEEVRCYDKSGNKYYQQPISYD